MSATEPKLDPPGWFAKAMPSPIYTVFETAMAPFFRMRQLITDLASRRLVGAVVAGASFIGLRNIDFNLTEPQGNLLALLVMTVLLWVFRVMPMALTAILAMALAVLLRIAPSDAIFGAFSTPTLFLLLGSFIVTASMTKHQLAERIALRLLLLHIIGGSTRRIVMMFGLIAGLLSTVLDNGAVAAILLPIGIGIARTFSGQLDGVKEEHKTSGFLCGLLLMVAYGSTVGALLTPLGDASNLVAWEFMQFQNDTNVSIGLWFAMAAPISIVLYIALCGIVIWMNPPEIDRIAGTDDTVKKRLDKLGPMSKGEKNTVYVFFGAILFWLLPSFASAAFGQGSEIHTFLIERLPPSVVAIIAACALFVLPTEKEGKLTMEWEDTSKMNFGPLFLVGATLALGSLMAETGLAGVISARLAGLSDGMPSFAFYGFAATIAILFSELTTNLVSVTVLVPFIPNMAESANADALTATWIATFAAIYGFMLPISTSANAIVYGSGQVPMKRMIKTGFLVDLSGVVVVVLGVITMTHVLSWI